MARGAAKSSRPAATGTVPPRPRNDLGGTVSLVDARGKDWLWPALGLIAAGAAVHANGMGGVFLFDDAYAIVDNVRIRRLWPPWPLLTTERPVVELSLAINYAIGKLNPIGYHLVNIATHIAAGLTLFGVVRSTVAPSPSRGRKPTDALPVAFAPGAASVPSPATGLAPSALIALSVALIWIVHPLQTESVTYVIQRAESMMGLFYLLTLYAFVRAVGPGVSAAKDRVAPAPRSDPRPPARRSDQETPQGPQQGPRGSLQRGGWLVLSVMACALAMGSKAVAVTVPLVVLLYDRCFVAGTFANAIRKRCAYYVGLAATWGVLVLCGVPQNVLAPATSRTAIGFGFKEFSAVQYALTQPEVILYYLRLSVWPSPLVLDYAWPVAKHAGDVWVSLTAVGVLVAAVVWGLRKNHWLGFVGAFFFLVLSPTSSIIPIRDVAVEHRMYLPLAAVIVVILAALESATRRWAPTLRSAWPAYVVAALVLLLSVPLAAVTVQRNRDYHDALTMWRDVTAKRPENARAHVNIGVLLERRGEVDAAIDAYRKALSLKPNYADAHFNMGVALMRQKRTLEAETAFRETLRLVPDDPGAHANLAQLLAGEEDLEGAAASYRAALQTAPQDAETRARLANTLRRLGERDAALAEAQLAVRLAPHLPAAHEALAHSLLAEGDMAAAVAEFRRTAELDPANLPARINLGTALKAQGHLEEAVEVYRQTLQVDPGSYYAHLHLGDTYMSLAKYAEAIVEFEAVLQSSPMDADAHAGLGHALRAVGRITEAAQHFHQAITINPNHADARKALRDWGLAP